MKLSDAIATGRTIVHALPGIVLDSGGLNGCALGMGYKANGGKIECQALEIGIGLEGPIRMWRWLKESCHLPLPCRCNISCGLNAGQIIAHLFDYHVMGSTLGLSEGEAVAQPWTLDEVIDWIASVEPADLPAEPLAAAPAEQQVEALQTVPGPISL